MKVAIDPGVHGLGVALFTDEGTLNMAYYCPEYDYRIPHELLRPLFALNVSAREWAIEIPVVRPTGLQKGPQSDIIDLAIVVGTIMGKHSDQGVITLVKPEEWGGQIPKRIKNQRVLERLSEAEKATIKTPSKQSLAHNIFDAIGIGLHVFTNRGLM